MNQRLIDHVNHQVGEKENFPLQEKKLSIDNVVRKYGNLVHKVARKYAYAFGLESEDLAQEGFVGLLDAIEKYEASKCAEFGYFAKWKIKSAIRNYLKTRGFLIKVTDKDEADQDGANRSTRLERPVVKSLDTDVDRDEMRLLSVPITDLIGDDLAQIENFETKKDYQCLLDCLDKRQKFVMKALLGWEMELKTPGEVGEILGVTAARVNQIYQEARETMAKVNHLRESLPSKLAKKYLSIQIQKAEEVHPQNSKTKVMWERKRALRRVA